MRQLRLCGHELAAAYMTCYDVCWQRHVQIIIRHVDHSSGLRQYYAVQLNLLLLHQTYILRCLMLLLSTEAHVMMPSSLIFFLSI